MPRRAVCPTRSPGSSPAIQAFGDREGPDRKAALGAVRHPRLDRSLSEQGAGIDGVLDDLLVAVEHACLIGTPGFISASGTTAADAASTASAVAGGQRYLLRASNALERVGLRWLALVCGGSVGGARLLRSSGARPGSRSRGAVRLWARAIGE